MADFFSRSEIDTAKNAAVKVKTRFQLKASPPVYCSKGCNPGRLGGNGSRRRLEITKEFPVDPQENLSLSCALKFAQPKPRTQQTYG